MHEKFSAMLRPAIQQGQHPINASFQVSFDWNQPERSRNGWTISFPEDEDTAGFASLFRTTRRHALLSLVLKPGLRPESVGNTLLEALVEWAAEKKLEHLNVYARREEGEAAAFLTRHNFFQDHTAYLLEAPEGISIPEPRFPDGYFLRSFSELNHLPTLAALLNRAYHIREGYIASENLPVTVEFLEGQFERYPDYFPPEGMFILLNTYGKAIAFVRASGLDSINAPGIVPEERENNLHIPLMQMGMAYHNKRGAKRYRMYLNQAGRHLLDEYRSLGFSVKKTFDVYQYSIQRPVE